MDLILELCIVAILELFCISVSSIFIIKYRDEKDYTNVRLFFITILIFAAIFCTSFEIVWVAKLLGY